MFKIGRFNGTDPCRNGVFYIFLFVNNFEAVVFLKSKKINCPGVNFRKVVCDNGIDSLFVQSFRKGTGDDSRCIFKYFADGSLALESSDEGVLEIDDRVVDGVVLVNKDLRFFGAVFFCQNGIGLACS